jgi:hypothetical protein
MASINYDARAVSDKPGIMNGSQRKNRWVVRRLVREVSTKRFAKENGPQGMAGRLCY